jgi:hypothetical protein
VARSWCGKKLETHRGAVNAAGQHGRHGAAGVQGSPPAGCMPTACLTTLGKLCNMNALFAQRVLALCTGKQAGLHPEGHALKHIWTPGCLGSKGHVRRCHVSLRAEQIDRHDAHCSARGYQALRHAWADQQGQTATPVVWPLSTALAWSVPHLDAALPGSPAPPTAPRARGQHGGA